MIKPLVIYHNHPPSSLFNCVTFTKFFRMPEISKIELSEGLRWSVSQVQDCELGDTGTNGV